MKPLPFLSANSTLKGFVFAIALVLIAAAVISLFNIRFETNIINSLPRGNAVMDEGAYVLEHHPYQNRIFIDLALNEKNPDELVAAAETLENRLRESGLFQTVGAREMGRLFPKLMAHVAENLPVLFTAEELEDEITPILQEGSVKQRLEENLSGLFTMDGMGRSDLALKDPLGLSSQVLEKLQHLVPAQEVRFHKGQLLSADERHLLVIANPKEAGTGAKSARKIDDTIKQATRELKQKHQGEKADFTVTPVGAYRAVIDNETTAKSDTKNALFFATLGIACLLMLAFPRPYIGLLAFLPAVFGTVCALAFYSIWHSSISVMTIGFGAAIISITVDHGISYLLFLDQPYETKGKAVSREVRAVALIAALTSVGAFFMLSFSGFPVLGEIGQFAAFGIAFSFIFVHSCFPLLFPSLKAAKRPGKLFLQTAVDRISGGGGGSYKPVLALMFAAVMAFFANPDFNLDISEMNTVKKQTITAEKLVAEVWGQQLFDKVYLMAEAPSLAALQDKSDRLARSMAEETESKTISEAFFPAAVFPGKQRCQNNLAAWKTFWQDHDREGLEKEIRRAASALGMPGSAFSGVYEAGKSPCNGGLDIAPEFHEMLGIHHFQTEDDEWMLFSSLTPGPDYDPQAFFNTYSAKKQIHVFDPDYYSSTISDFLSQTFVRMLIVIGISVTLLLLLFFMDPVLTGVALLPIGFSLICTLGVLSLVGLPLNMPGLMLSVVVVGMGLDYSLYMVRSYQRYRDERHPYQAHIRMTVFLAGASTLIGFGTLAMGEHNLMKSMGQVLVIGIFFVMAGTFALLPPFLRYLFRPVQFSGESARPGAKLHQKRIRALYRHLEAYPRLFALFKRRIDPMFAELPDLIRNPAVVIDIGCGFGVTAAWMRAMNPEINIYGADPYPERARIAARLTEPHGKIYTAAAPDLPDFQVQADLALMLDMIHYLSDTQLASTLQKIRKNLQPDATLLIRATIAADTHVPMLRRIEEFKNRLKRTKTCYRSADRIRNILTENGFAVRSTRPSGTEREEVWFLTENTATKQ
ncbi:MAG: MMPL family transporter [Desulfosalsimonas sp.]|uniref:MMPL family transporter n=1 Tax=Desulfosalsimonas sp. TaxID=3073848 RepID=UPI003970E6E8